MTLARGPVVRPITRPRVTVIVAFHNPNDGLARRQIESVLRQKDVDLSVIAVLDGPEASRNETIRDLLAKGRADILPRREAGGVRNAFAAGLALALETYREPDRYFAYCDQDDVWHSDKLIRTISRFDDEDVHLVHCDARVADPAGSEIAASLHRHESRRQPQDLLESLLLNTVTGMTCVFTAATAKVAAAVMRDYDGQILHDHITAVAAHRLGRVAYLDEALVDYVQHGRNALGARVHRPAWRRRGFGLYHISQYRRTSAMLFEERRKVCRLLLQQVGLPREVSVMFLADGRENPFLLVSRYVLAVLRMVCRLQFRRAMLCLRMLDAAASMRIRSTRQFRHL